MEFALLSRSVQVSEAELRLLATAARRHLGEVALLWGIKRPLVEAFPGFAKAPANMISLVLLDTPGKDEQGLEGYHDRDQDGAPFARVFVDAVPGRKILHDPGGQGECVATVVMHELAEAALDADANIWCDGPYVDNQGKIWAQVARELCDPVQCSTFDLHLAGTPVSFPNVVAPNWFDAHSHGEQYDLLRQLKAPLTCLPGGYVIARNGAEVVALDGALVPGWLRDAKARHGRTLRRGAVWR